MTRSHKFTYVEPEMDELGHKKRPCEEKHIFSPKIAPENEFKKRGFYL